MRSLKSIVPTTVAEQVLRSIVATTVAEQVLKSIVATIVAEHVLKYEQIYLSEMTQMALYHLSFTLYCI